MPSLRFDESMPATLTTLYSTPRHCVAPPQQGYSTHGPDPRSWYPAPPSFPAGVTATHSVSTAPSPNVKQPTRPSYWRITTYQMLLWEYAGFHNPSWQARSHSEETGRVKPSLPPHHL